MASLVIDSSSAWAASLLDVLDGMQIGAYLLDVSECAVLWNRHFMKFFPEHADHMAVGEPYRENLRRFYAARLSGPESAQIDRYIAAGERRNREQTRPYCYEHRGRTLQASAVALPDGGRLRLWQVQLAPGDAPLEQSVPLGADAASFGFEHVADGVMVTDETQRLLACNKAFVALYGLAESAAALGQPFEAVYEAAWSGAGTVDRLGLGVGMALLREQMRFSGSPFELPLPAGRWVRVMEQRSPDGRRFFVHVDISSMKRQQRRLVEAERQARESELALQHKQALLEATLERMDEGVMMVNADRIVEVCNRRAIELLDLPPALMASRPSFEAVLAHQWAHEEFSQTPAELKQFVRDGGITDRRHSYERRRPNGRMIEVHSVPLGGGGVLRTYIDITERKRNEERIRHMARHDGLTTLVNREVFLEYLAGAVDNADRVRQGFAVHFIDLDRFKPINDCHGHAIGDKVLSMVAERMRGVARELDIVARMGGDEFALLQFNVAGTHEAVALARRLLDALRKPMALEGQVLAVGASIGIALCQCPGMQADTLLRQADAAMYRAKSDNQGGVHLHAAPTTAS